jgi:hypothetical protein
LLRPALFPKEFFKLRLGKRKTVRFFCLVPLYEDEMNFKLKVGSDELLDRLDAADVTELLDIERPSVCGRRR